MSEHFDRISSCEQITEWITPQDDRLVKVTGLKPPVDANTLREEWDIERAEIPELLTVIKRLLVPEALTDRVDTRFDVAEFGENTLGTVALVFKDQTDWQKCLPLSEHTLAFDRDGARGNAALAVCGQIAGLAVMAMEVYDEGELDFAVQPVRPAKLEQILAA